MNACQLPNPKIWPLFTAFVWASFLHAPKPEVSNFAWNVRHRDVKLGREARQEMQFFFLFALSALRKYDNSVGIVNPSLNMEQIRIFDAMKIVIALNTTMFTFAST